MAQLGDLARARTLVRQAARAFGPKEALARARCVVAEAEIALVSRDLGWPGTTLDAARKTLEQQGDHLNAAHARCLAVRRLLLVGRLHEAERELEGIQPASLPPALRTAHELAVAGIAMRRVQAAVADAALERARQAVRLAGIAALAAEVESLAQTLHAPAARRVSQQAERWLSLAEVEALLASEALVVDGCRHAVHAAGTTVPLASRPVLFALARKLAEAWPADVARDALIRHAFRARLPDDSHRARLRVEIGRLRAVLKALADVRATPQGFALVPHAARQVAVVARPAEEAHAAVLALLADGESWSSSALALALGASQRTVQRSLDALAAAGKVQPLGRGRARRWMSPPMPGFATVLLLPAPLPGD